MCHTESIVRLVSVRSCRYERDEAAHGHALFRSLYSWAAVPSFDHGLLGGFAVSTILSEQSIA